MVHCLQKNYECSGCMCDHDTNNGGFVRDCSTFIPDMNIWINSQICKQTCIVITLLLNLLIIIVLFICTVKDRMKKSVKRKIESKSMIA